jgi:hypothetical protein
MPQVKDCERLPAHIPKILMVCWQVRANFSSDGGNEVIPPPLSMEGMEEGKDEGREGGEEGEGAGWRGGR